MSQPELLNEEADFETQLASLIVEAARLQKNGPQQQDEPAVEKKPAPSPSPLTPPPTAAAAVPMPSTAGLLQMLKPMVMGLEALSRAVSENTSAIGRVTESIQAQAALPELMTSMQDTLEKKQILNQRLFDSLYEELRGYKDGFLLDVLHKPIVRDLITLFDDLSSINQQVSRFSAEQEMLPDLTEREQASLDQVKTISNNIDHIVHSVVEVMERVEVTMMEPSSGKLNKVTQRAVAVESAEREEEDSCVARSVKPGFVWRERVIRPELVVIKKWKDNYLVALPTTLPAA